MPNSSKKENMVMSYLTMRSLLGALGFSLPFVLMIAAIMTEDSLRMSISSFYYSPSPVIQGFFVGILCAMGVFLISYKGYEPKEDELISDDHVAWATGIGAIGIGLVPISEECVSCGCGLCTGALSNLIHYGSVLLFFGATVFMLFYKFTRTDEKGPQLKQRSEHELLRKRVRNRIYRICAWVIAACILALIAQFFAQRLLDGERDFISKYSVVFWIESIAVWAFGVAWIVKGKILLSDYSKDSCKNKT